MLATIVLGFLVVFSIYYAYFITHVRIGLLSLKYARPHSVYPTVSIVVAVRNEAQNIEKCLQSLLQQTYSTKAYEIIVVDDGSTDDTISIVKKYTERYSHVRLFCLPTKKEMKRGYKPNAIEKGITESKGEIILTTDGDCLVPPHWIEVMTSHFEENVVFVAGPVIEQDSVFFLSKLERLEFLGLITTAAGLIGSGRPIICNGANIAYRKSTFETVKGFAGDYSSNDDESLMNKMVHRNLGRVVFAPETEASVTTQSSDTLMSFLRQRVRWANKRGHYEDKSIFITLFSLYLFFFSLVFTIVLISIEPLLWLPATIAFIGKILIDYFTLRAGAKLFRQDIPLFQFLIAELLHVPYIVIAAAVGQFASMHWKGRLIRR